MYVCGITPYDYAHMGHGRCYVTFDVLYRLLRFFGYEVTYCRNFTDIDDKLLARSLEEYGDPTRYQEIADFYIAAYHQDMQRLGCLPPIYEPRVTQHIKPIIEFVEELIATNHAYVADRDVYYSIESFPAYGKLSKRNIDDLLAGARVSINEKKRNPLDFALWKSDETVFWQSPWGKGRPGWHIECSTLARLYLGNEIDIHGGGMDLIFPHHENEIAQSEALTHATFARYWVHNAFVRIDHEKMSKSLKNYVTLHDLTDQHDPMMIRYLILQHQYRNPLDFSLDELPGVLKSYQRLCKIFGDQELPERYRPAFGELMPAAQRMMQFLGDDLNTPGMLGVVFEHAKYIQGNSELKKQVGFIMKNILGLAFAPVVEEVIEVTPQIQEMIAERERARARKDWATADALRDKLRELGFDVRDHKL